jgi:antitoxin MazE
MIVDLKQKSQVTIPKKIVEKLNLKVGDKIDIEEKDGKLILTPVAIVPKDQVWFYSPEWQKGETEVDRQLKEGKVHIAQSLEKLFEDLEI